MDEIKETTELNDAVTDTAEEIPESETPVAEESSPLEEDIKELKAGFAELSELESITELDNPVRYAALRDIGLSPSEAYLLTSRRIMKQDNRAHLTSTVPAAAKSPDIGLGKHEMAQLRDIFGDVSDAEIYNLYKKVTQ